MAIERAFASASFALDAAAYTQVDGMTLTPGAGDFLAFFSMDVTFPVSAAFELLHAAIFVNGVILAESEREIESEASLDLSQFPILSHALVSPTAGQVVEVRYFSTATGEFTGFNRELTLFPAAVSTEASATADDTLGGGPGTTLGGMSLTPPAGDHLLLFTSSADGPGGVVAEFRVTIGGVVVPHTARLFENEDSAPFVSLCVMIAAAINVDGAELVEIEWQRITGGGGTFTAHERTMTLVETLAADIFEASATADDTSVSTVDELMDGMTITDPGARDYLALFSSSDFYGFISADAKTTYTIYENGAAVAGTDRTHEHEDSIDEIDMAVYAGGRINVGTSTSDVQIFWRSSITTIRTIHERTLVIIREEAGAAVSQTVLGSHEALQEVVTTVLPNHEARGFLTQTALVSYEALASAQAQVVAPHESLEGVVQSALAPHEARGFLDVTILASHEARGFLTQTALVSYEALLSVDAQVVASHESLEGVVQSVLVPHEAAGFLIAAITAAWEAQAELEVAASVGHEALLTVENDVAASHEALAELVQAVVASHEATGVVIQAITVHHEATGRVAQIVVVPHEARGRVVQTVTVVYEATGSVIRAAQVGHEAAGSVIRAVQLSHEALGGIDRAAVNPFEALEGVLRAVIVNWEIGEQFEGSVIMAFDLLITTIASLELVINETVDIEEEV